MRLLTYNVLQCPVLDGSRARAAAALRTIERVAPDVIVLNEAFNMAARRVLLGGLLRAGYYATPQVGGWRQRQAWTGSSGDDRPWRRLVGGGVHILSRRPILLAYQHVYTVNQRGTQDALCNKGVALALIDTTWVAGTHLQADEEPVPVADTHEVRMRQLAELRELVIRHVPPGEPVILAGDLNIEFHGGDHYLDAEKVLGGRLLPEGTMHEPTFDCGNPLVARHYPGYSHVLDYVGSLNGPAPHIATETLVSDFGSDHYPVLATISS
ncbi:sphingomyelin phosphodiesterase [Nonomuraea sp. NPDC050556]|uniref:sphingomyelin phosphodiesterase n=1 Tax=Nonomuraea sp. NPDC050556 TaxID=3364369 RepID=UPI00378F9CFC